jgi:hypothetical protein
MHAYEWVVKCANIWSSFLLDLRRQAFHCVRKHIKKQARIVGGGGNQGKCAVEVVVDGSAEVEILGGNAFLRPLSGQQLQLRRFECTGVMPINPMDFRFR